MSLLLQDDILPKLMTSTGSQEDLFKKEIAKYDQICEEIAQNIEAQEQILLQLQSKNDDFAAMFNLEDFKVILDVHVNILSGILTMYRYGSLLFLKILLPVAREKSYKQIAAAVAKYREIKESIIEGLKFYVTLQDALTNVKQQCSDFIMTRSIQCRELIEDVQRQIAGLNFATDGKTGYNYPSGYLQPFPSTGQPDHQRTTQQPEPQSTPPPSHPQPSYHHVPAEQPGPVYLQPYPSTGQPDHQRTTQQPEPQSTPPPSRPQPPYHHLPAEQPRPRYAHPYPAYAAPQQTPYYAPVGQYQHPQQPPNHEYWQPAYPGWHGAYYNAYQQQTGPYPAPSYTVPAPYPPPQQGSYHRR
ncbi:unnamed protein product [Musa textilis]